MRQSPETLGAEAQLGLGRTHLTVRAPRRLHKGPVIQTILTLFSRLIYKDTETAS